MKASDVLAIARDELGVTELPRGSNRVKYNNWYYGHQVEGDAYPWCMVFLQWVFRQAGGTTPLRTASCGALMRAAKKAGQWVTEDYRPGDVLIYDFPGGAATDHCGLCESADGGTVTAIEGNTSAGNAANGGAVMRMTRSSALVVGAWRPEYESEEDEKMTQDEFDEMFKTAMTRYRAGLQDNDCGGYSEEGRKFVQENGLLMGGDALPDGEANFMWQDFLTREQFSTVLLRFARKFGLTP